MRDVAGRGPAIIPESEDSEITTDYQVWQA